MGQGAAAGAGSFASGATALAGAYSQSQAMEAQAIYQKTQSEMNAKLADMQAADAIKRGNKNAAQVGKNAKRVLGAQRAALAAQGIDIDSGSAADVQQDTEVLSAMDQMTVKNNAWKEAWGFKVQALNTRAEGDWAMAAGQQAARNTLLTGGMNALSYTAQGAYSVGKARKGDTKGEG